MSVTYKKLRLMLVEKNMKKKDLQEQAGLTHHEMLKLRNDMSITTDTIGKICRAMNCEPTDIMEFVDIEVIDYLLKHFCFRKRGYDV